MQYLSEDPNFSDVTFEELLSCSNYRARENYEVVLPTTKFLGFEIA